MGWMTLCLWEEGMVGDGKGAWQVEQGSCSPLAVTCCSTKLLLFTGETWMGTVSIRPKS